MSKYLVPAIFVVIAIAICYIPTLIRWHRKSKALKGDDKIRASDLEKYGKL